jgi:hypothetical protein
VVVDVNSTVPRSTASTETLLTLDVPDNLPVFVVGEPSRLYVKGVAVG